MNARIAAHDLLNVVRIDVLAGNNNQIVLSPNDVQFLIHDESKITGAVPPVLHCLRRQIRAVIISGEQRVALNQDLAHMTVR